MASPSANSLLTIVLYGRDRNEVNRLVGEFAGVFTNADGSLYRRNLQPAQCLLCHGPRQLRDEPAPPVAAEYELRGSLVSLHDSARRDSGISISARNIWRFLKPTIARRTYLNLHNGEVAHTLILGMTGSGKSYLCNFLLQNAQKYQPLTFIFDIGGSFQSLTTIFGGSYLNVGRESRDFTINPFSLPRTEENMQFLFAFFRTLIEGNDARYRLDYREERKLWDGIERVYVLEPEQRTVSNFANILGELKDRLHRWTRHGQYGFLFDNPEDTLSFSRFQTFNFAGWGDAPQVLEPLLFYVLHRASNEITDPCQARHLQNVPAR